MKRASLFILMVMLPLIANATTYEVTTPGNNVGIGSTNPGQALDVQGTIRTIGFSMGGVTSTTVTGTGANVFATSPTLTTPNLGTPSAINLSNATGTATNVSVGTANALNSATTIVNVSSATAPSNGQVLTATGSTAATWQTPSGGGVNDWARNSSTNAIYPANIGDNVGIGSIVPGAQLDVNGTVRASQFTSGTGTAYIQGNGNNIGINKSGAAQALDVNGTVKAINFTMTSSPTAGYFMTASDSSGDTTWNTITLTTTGSSGASTWTPSTDTLNIPQYSGGGSSQWTTVHTNDVYLPNNGNVGLGTTFTNGGAALTVMNGNVGIGTWAPSSAFQIGTGTSAFNITSGGVINNLSQDSATFITNENIRLNNNGGTSLGNINGGASTSLTIYGGEGNSSSLILESSSGSNGTQDSIIFKGGRGTTQAMGIVWTGAIGNVGIGSASPGSRLDVQGTVRALGFSTGNTSIGTSGTGSTSCLCKTFSGGICTVIGTCS